MVSNIIALRIDNNTSELIDKLIKYNIATNRTSALRWIMQNGMQSAKKTIERKEKSQDIIKEWREKGLPVLPIYLSEISIKERD